MPYSITASKSGKSCRIDTKNGILASRYALGLRSYSLPSTILRKGSSQVSLGIILCRPFIPITLLQNFVKAQCPFNFYWKQSELVSLSLQCSHKLGRNSQVTKLILPSRLGVQKWIPYEHSALRPRGGDISVNVRRANTLAEARVSA